MGLKLEEIIYLFNKIDDKILCHKEYLSDLDFRIGDGDHGINLSCGLRSARKELANREFKDWGEIFELIGDSIKINVNGISGKLYGNSFNKVSLLGKGKVEINITDYRDILRTMIEEIKIVGNVEKGDKTILDSLIPAYEEINYGIENNISTINTLKNSVEAAKNGVEYTKLVSSRKGRASYLGERSIGYQDPGATSALMMIEVVNDVVKELR